MKPVYGIADHPTREGSCLGWLAYVTENYPDGLYRGEKSAKQFTTREAAEAYNKEHELEGHVRPLPID